ncbi:hypothetical protein Hsc_1062 [Herbaspirillum seropedicae]|nr:hypothetical protein Hsc_1062 [Herbaspirillum seropedicae]
MRWPGAPADRSATPAMMHAVRRRTAVFPCVNSQSYGDLPPLLGTKLGGVGISMEQPRRRWSGSAARWRKPVAIGPGPAQTIRTKLVKLPQSSAPGSHCCTARQAMLIGPSKTHISVSRPGQKGINRKFRYVVILLMH